ncbi:DoxX family membrane protein [Pseudonocardia sp. T1-2H]|uniref:DoxX family membrane protein n=1 Tax=Pseudonocardia sp. T1-2H TaxID=3128899 RepID=UPI003100DBFA
MFRTLPAPARDVLLLAARLLVSFVMLAHVWDTFIGTGFTKTIGAFSNFGIPIAIVATAFTLVAELVGSLLLASGIFVTWASGAISFVMAGAIYFVHAPHGIFVKNGGWELVGMIIAVCLGIAATGPGRYSLDHLIFDRKVTEPPAPAPIVVTQDTPVAPAQRWANGTGASGALRASERRTAAVRIAEHNVETAGFGAVASRTAEVDEFGFASEPAPARTGPVQVQTPGSGAPAVGMASLRSRQLPGRRPAPEGDENTHSLFTTRGD